jgi:FMN reductase
MLPGLGAAFTRDNLSRPAATVVKAIEEAGALIAGTRVYQGPYAGLFEHQLRPLFGFLTALAFADRHIYATDGDFVDYQLTNPTIIDRCAATATQVVELLNRRSTNVLQSRTPRDLTPSSS